MAGRRIAILLSGAAVAGLGIVAFFQASPAWSFAATVFLPAASALAAVVAILKGRAAPFCIGFAVCSAALMVTPFALGLPNGFLGLAKVFIDDEYASSLPEHEQQWYYERKDNQLPIVAAALVVGVASLVGVAACLVVPPVVAALERRFSVRRVMIAIAVVAAALTLGRAEHRNYELTQRLSLEGDRIAEAVDSAVAYAEILHEGGMGMLRFKPSKSGVTLDAENGELTDGIAKLFVEGDLLALTLNGTTVPESAHQILSAAFEYHQEAEQLPVYRRRSAIGRPLWHVDVIFLQLERPDKEWDALGKHQSID